ncbi:MAG: cell division protein FtsQ/DivIB [Woeseiaceae bacterium]
MSPAARQAGYLKQKKASTVSYQWLNWLLPICMGCAIVFYTQDYLSQPQTLPVKRILVHGNFKNIDEKMLHQAIKGVIDGGYFNIDVKKVRQVVEQIPWVSKASVRRVWPDKLSVSVVEQVPVAISKEYGLINSNGDVFKPIANTDSKGLPVFEGKEELNKLMLENYFEMNEILSTVKEKITYLKFDARHALELTLGNGLKIVLGREDNLKRLERFIAVYKKILLPRIDDIEKIDLRYTNGMAIGWKSNTKITNALGDMKNV